MKKNESKVANLISNKVAQQLEGIKDATSKSKTLKAKKTKAQLVEASKDAAKEFADVKYVYPDDITDTLARKKWRQQTRNELHRLEREMFRIKDQNSKEFKKAAKAYEDFRNKVLKPEQVA